MEALLQQQTLSSCPYKVLPPHRQPIKGNLALLYRAHVAPRRVPTSKPTKKTSRLSAVRADDVSSLAGSNPPSSDGTGTPATWQEQGSARDLLKFHGEMGDSGISSLLSPPSSSSSSPPYPSPASSVSPSSPSTLPSPTRSPHSKSLSSLSPSPSPGGLDELPIRSRGVRDFLERAPELINSVCSSPRWFCPLECGKPPEKAPVLLFLPGIDGTGLGLIRHYENLGRMFEVRCLHIPLSDRTPAEGLVKLVEGVVKEESYKAPSKPIYLVGDSLGGALALAVAARNPKVDLVLVLANPSTSFIDSHLQPIFPFVGLMPDQIYHAMPFLLSFTMGDPIRIALATVDKKQPDLDVAQALRDSLAALLPTLPILADIIPKETLLWKLKLLRSMAMYANSRLHAVKAQVLVLASGKDQMLPSGDEAQRLLKVLSKCVVRYYKDAGHTLLLEDGLDLGTAIRGALMYRNSRTFDSVADFVYPTSLEFEEFYQRTKLLRKLISPVFFSTLSDGTIVHGLSGVPEEGPPVLLVGYHMLVGIDIVPLVTEFLKRKQVIRGVTHPFFFTRVQEKGLTEPGLNDDVRVFGGFTTGKKNFVKALSRRESVLLYPGGAREALHRKGEAYKLFWPEKAEFVRAAARFGVTIVPFGTVGEDDMLELLLDYNDIHRIPFYEQIFDDFNTEAFQVRHGQSGEVGNQVLHLPLFAPRPPGRMYFLFGKPFRTAGREQELQNKEVADNVYKAVKKDVEDCLQYLLKKRKEDPYRAFFPRFLYESFLSSDWQAPTFNP